MQSHQKKLDRLTDLSEALGKSFGELQVLLDSPEKTDVGPAVSSFMNTFISIALMARHEAEGAAEELSAYGLEKKYESELKVVRQVVDMTWQPADDLEQRFVDLRGMLFSLTLVQEAVLEARMKDLFSEYLPTRRTPKLNS